VGVCDTKAEERENLKESREIFAYPYFTPSGQKCPAEGTRFRTAVLLVLSAFIGVHRRSSAADIGFCFSHWAGTQYIWPPMNADERG
jgi:hypothetical protein